LYERWGVWFALDGDLRFLSHHDMMRAMERTALRAEIPVKFSEGFNPRPHIALVCPRPVGVATCSDLVVTRLETGQSAEELVSSLNRHAPAGLQFLRAAVVHSRQTPTPRQGRYELPLRREQADIVADRLEDLSRQDAWCVQRLVSGKGARRRAPKRPRTLDIKPMVCDLALEADTLRWTLVPQDQAWARPGEVLTLAGLDDRVDLARVVRVNVAYEPVPGERDPN